MNYIKSLFAVLVMLCVTSSAFADEVVVRTAKEFIDALGSNRTVVIDTEEPLVLTHEVDVRLSQLSDYDENPIKKGICYVNNFDGNGLVVVGFDNLTIKTKNNLMATLLSTPRYADVMMFINCENLHIENIIMGHTDEGYCQRGVLGLQGCRGVYVKESDFFGCGTEGFVIEDCNDVYINKSAVHDCAYHTMHVERSRNINFKDCYFHDNREFSQVNVYGSEGVHFTNCTFKNLQGPLFSIDSVLDFKNCSFEQVTHDFKEKTPYLVFDNKCTFDTSKEPNVPLNEALYDKYARLLGDNLSGYWSDGIYNYNVYMEGETAVFANDIMGRFTLSPMDISAGTWQMGPYEDQEHDIYDCKYIPNPNGPAFIAVLDDGHTVMDCFYQSEEDYSSFVPNPQVLEPFYGMYKDQNGKEAYLGPEKVKIGDIEGEYSIKRGFAVPEPVIIIYNANGPSKDIEYYLVLTKEGMEVHENVLNDELQEDQPGKLLYTLKFDFDVERAPRWMYFMSSQIHPKSAFMYVPKDILAIMRNLPYALRGYPFGKAALKEYFESQFWYTPGSAEGVKIEQYEEFNCSLIKYIEKFESEAH